MKVLFMKQSSPIIAHPQMKSDLIKGTNEEEGGVGLKWQHLPIMVNCDSKKPINDRFIPNPIMQDPPRHPLPPLDPHHLAHSLAPSFSSSLISLLLAFCPV